MKDIDLTFKALRSTEPYLDDNGFTGVVMAQLTATRRELPLWVKNLIVLSATLLGSLIVAMQMPGDVPGLLVSLASLPGLDAELLLSAASQNLPVVLVACFMVAYAAPYGAYLAMKRGSL